VLGITRHALAPLILFFLGSLPPLFAFEVPVLVFKNGAEVTPATLAERRREEIRVRKEVELSLQLHLEPRKQEIETLAAQYQRLLQGCFDCTEEEASRVPPPTPTAGLGQTPEVLELQWELEAKLRALDAEEKHYWDELRDQARRQGIPPGWLREPPPNSELGREVAREVADSQAVLHEKAWTFTQKDFRTPEAYWRFRKRMAEMDVRTAELDVLILEQQLQTAMTDWLVGTRCWEGQGCTFNLGRWDLLYQSHTAELRGQLAQKQAQLQEARHLLADLPDELRRAGGEPDWLR
jgi:hypothetical protein